MGRDFIFFDSHPIQYNVQIYSGLTSIFPNDVLVVYKDMPEEGQYEADFGKTITWGIPLREGYTYLSLDFKQRARSVFDGYADIFRIFRENRPRVAFLQTFSNPVFPAVLLCALIFGTKIWLRADSNDIAFKRSKLKTGLRGLVYNLLYTIFDRLFYVGRLNKDHYLHHGVPASKLTFAPRCVADPIARLDDGEKRQKRLDWRRDNQIADHSPVVMFVGKFIAKKNPAIIFKAMENKASLPADTTLVMVGSGPLEAELVQYADQLTANGGIRTIFAGFKNQVELIDCYLGADILVLPSTQSGETWGLVVNEALQAGQSVIVSNFVGCGPDFSSLERVRIFDAGNPDELHACIEELATYPHDFDWARSCMSGYSFEAAVRAIATEWSVVKAVR